MKAHHVWHILDVCDECDQFTDTDLITLGLTPTWARALTEDEPASALKVLLTVATIMKIDYSPLVESPNKHTPFLLRTLIVKRLVLMALRDLKLRAEEHGVSAAVPADLQAKLRDVWPEV